MSNVTLDGNPPAATPLTGLEKSSLIQNNLDKTYSFEQIVDLVDTNALLESTSQVTGLDTALSSKEVLVNKDAEDGYVGLDGFNINFNNTVGTFTSELTNTNTASRTYTFPDESGTVALEGHLENYQPLDRPPFAVDAPITVDLSQDGGTIELSIPNPGTNTVTLPSWATDDTLGDGYGTYIFNISSTVYAQLEVEGSDVLRGDSLIPPYTIAFIYLYVSNGISHARQWQSNIVNTSNINDLPNHAIQLSDIIRVTDSEGVQYNSTGSQIANLVIGTLPVSRAPTFKSLPYSIQSVDNQDTVEVSIDSAADNQIGLPRWHAEFNDGIEPGYTTIIVNTDLQKNGRIVHSLVDSFTGDVFLPPLGRMNILLVEEDPSTHVRSWQTYIEASTRALVELPIPSTLYRQHNRCDVLSDGQSITLPAYNVDYAVPWGYNVNVFNSSSTDNLEILAAGEGVVDGTSISDEGIGYDNTLTCTFVPVDTGSGATGYPQMQYGVASVTMDDEGSSYVAPVTIIFSGGGAEEQATAHAEIDAGNITGIVIDTPGKYLFAPNITITGTGSGALAHATLGTTNGSVRKIELTSGGQDYTTAPTIAFSGGGGGSGAAATATISSYGDDLLIGPTTLLAGQKCSVLLTGEDTMTSARTWYVDTINAPEGYDVLSVSSNTTLTYPLPKRIECDTNSAGISITFPKFDATACFVGQGIEMINAGTVAGHLVTPKDADNNQMAASLDISEVGLYRISNIGDTPVDDNLSTILVPALPIASSGTVSATWGGIYTTPVAGSFTYRISNNVITLTFQDVIATLNNTGVSMTMASPSVLPVGMRPPNDMQFPLSIFDNNALDSTWGEMLIEATGAITVFKLPNGAPFAGTITIRQSGFKARSLSYELA